jgi:glycosyltransferase involved in cell wall biosynthesis
VVPQGDAEGLADRIARLLADPQQRARMGRSGRERVEAHYGLDAMAAALLALYERLHAGTRGTELPS